MKPQSNKMVYRSLRKNAERLRRSGGTLLGNLFHISKTSMLDCGRSGRWKTKLSRAEQHRNLRSGIEETQMSSSVRTEGVQTAKQLRIGISRP